MLPVTLVGRAILAFFELVRVVFGLFRVINRTEKRDGVRSG